MRSFSISTTVYNNIYWLFYFYLHLHLHFLPFSVSPSSCFRSYSSSYYYFLTRHPYNFRSLIFSYHFYHMKYVYGYGICEITSLSLLLLCKQIHACDMIYSLNSKSARSENENNHNHLKTEQKIDHLKFRFESNGVKQKKTKRKSVTKEG